MILSPENIQIAAAACAILLAACVALTIKIKRAKKRKV